MWPRLLQLLQHDQQAVLSAVLHVLQEAVQSAIVQGPKAMVQLPSGEQVPVRSLVVPPVKGRKVVLLGDTCDSHAILSESLLLVLAF